MARLPFSLPQPLGPSPDSGDAAIAPTSVVGAGFVPTLTVGGDATQVEARLTKQTVQTAHVSADSEARLTKQTVQTAHVSADSEARFTKQTVQVATEIPKMEPAAIVGVATILAPTVGISATGMAGVATVPAPTVSAGTGVGILATAVAGTSVVPVPTVTTPDVIIEPASIAVTAFVSDAHIDVIVTPTAFAGVGSVVEPSLSAGSAISASAVLGSASVPAAVVTTEESVDITATALAVLAVMPEPVWPILPVTVAGAAMVAAPTVEAYISTGTISFVMGLRSTEVTAESITLPSILGTVVRRSSGDAKRRTRGPSRRVTRP